MKSFYGYLGIMLMVSALLAQIKETVEPPKEVVAQVKEVVAEAEYVMSDGETPSFAEQRALEKAKRNAVEEAGVFIQSQSVVQDFQLVKDEIVALSGGMLEVKVLEEKRYFREKELFFYARIKALVDLSDIQEIRAFMADKTLVEEHAQLQEDYKNLTAEMDRLKQELAQLKEKENPEVLSARAEIVQKMGTLEQQYQARVVYEKAARGLRKAKKEKDHGKPHGRGRMDREERLFQIALKLDAKFVDPLVKLAEVHHLRGNKIEGNNFLNRAKKMHPKRASVLMRAGKFKDKDEDDEDDWKKPGKPKNKK